MYKMNKYFQYPFIVVLSTLYKYRCLPMVVNTFAKLATVDITNSNRSIESQVSYPFYLLSNLVDNIDTCTRDFLVKLVDNMKGDCGMLLYVLNRINTLNSPISGKTVGVSVIDVINLCFKCSDDQLSYLLSILYEICTYIDSNEMKNTIQASFLAMFAKHLNWVLDNEPSCVSPILRCLNTTYLDHEQTTDCVVEDLPPH